MITDSNGNCYKPPSARRWFATFDCKGEILKWKATYRAELPCVAVDSVPQKVALISESVGEI